MSFIKSVLSRLRHEHLLEELLADDLYRRGITTLTDAYRLGRRDCVNEIELELRDAESGGGTRTGRWSTTTGKATHD